MTFFDFNFVQLLCTVSPRSPAESDRYERRTNRVCSTHGSTVQVRIWQMYRCRWNIEFFFKWIKQHLRIKAFYDTSENAVRVQVWIAISVYLLVAIFNKRHRLPASLYTILQVLSVTLFEKTPILQALSQYPLQAMNPNINNEPYLPGF